MNSFHSRAARSAQKPSPADKSVARQTGMLRADALLVASKLAPSRARARQLIDSGLVSVDDKTINKAGQLLPESAQLRVQGDAARQSG